MNRTYFVEFAVGQYVQWNYFGMPEGTKDKRGTGTIAQITINDYGPSGHNVRYDIRGPDGLVEDVPSSCVRPLMECGAV